MTVVGYARVSKREQNPNAQKAELHAAGAERVFVDHGDSSRVKDRPQWLACMDYLRAGDVLLVRRLDRLGGTERILIETLHELQRLPLGQHAPRICLSITRCSWRSCCGRASSP